MAKQHNFELLSFKFRGAIQLMEVGSVYLRMWSDLSHLSGLHYHLISSLAPYHYSGLFSLLLTLSSPYLPKRKINFAAPWPGNSSDALSRCVMVDLCVTWLVNCQSLLLSQRLIAFDWDSPMRSKKIHLFSMTTPIQPEVTTYVDLGDTNPSQPPFTPVQAKHTREDKLPMPPTTRGSQRTPTVVDLRSVAVKKGLVDVPVNKKIPKITETQETNTKEEPGNSVQNRAVDMAAISLLDRPKVSFSASKGSSSVVSDKASLRLCDEFQVQVDHAY
ncbi:hypothetical protein H4582DRAFT_2053997 [Lactarius indigo]|nr:hypothetical protein H4582DRAFT_2053997 [Lactarius indigo]